jgi:hypothetical protein
VVLVKGIYDDNPTRFWERLRLEHLAQFLAADTGRGAMLGLDKPLILPVKDAGSGSPAAVRRAILHELSYTLTGNRYSVRDAEGLARAMEAIDGTIALLAIPAVDSIAALKTALEALLGLLDEISTDSVLKRTVIAINLEHHGLTKRNLATRWTLSRFSRS